MWSKLEIALIYAHDIELIEVKDAIRDATSRRVSATRGYVDIQQSGNKVYFESAVERDFLLACKLDRQIINVTSQPISIKFREVENGATRHYTPDYLVEKDASLPLGQFSIGASAASTCLFEVKREQDLDRGGDDALRRIAAGYLWASSADDRSFSVITDTELNSQFGRHIRLLSSMVALPLSETSNALIIYMEKKQTATPTHIKKYFLQKGCDPSSITDAIWSLVAKGFLQIPKVDDIHPQDLLVFDYEAKRFHT